MRSSAAMICVRAALDAAFKNCCLRSGRYDGTKRNHFFPRVNHANGAVGTPRPGSLWGTYGLARKPKAMGKRAPRCVARTEARQELHPPRLHPRSGLTERDLQGQIHARPYAAENNA
jgi:hypothetical protein